MLPLFERLPVNANPDDALTSALEVLTAIRPHKQTERWLKALMDVKCADALMRDIDDTKLAMHAAFVFSRPRYARKLVSLRKKLPDMEKELTMRLYEMKEDNSDITLLESISLRIKKIQRYALY